MNYFPFHIGDYAIATRHLSWEEDCAFRRLLDVYYTAEKPLPADHRAVCRLVLATNDTQREAVAVVLSEFFIETPAGWINSRADREIEAMRAKQQMQRDKANKRWDKPKADPGNATASKPDATASIPDAVAMPPTPTPTPTPEEQEQESGALETETAAVKPVSTAKPRRSSKCPESFEVTSEMQEFAETHPAVDWRSETASFRDHEFDKPKSDWPGAWRNWIRRSAKNGPNARASPMSFRERDELAAIARVHEMTGGLVSAKPSTPRRPDALQEVFDARTAARRIDRLAVCSPPSSLRLDLVEQVGGD